MKLRREFIYDPNLVLYLPLWKLDGASFMSQDAYGHLCTATNATWRPEGVNFDGTGDLIQVASPTVIVAPTQGTIIIWFKPTTLNDATAHGLVGYGGDEARVTGARLINDTNYYLNWLGWNVADGLDQVRGGTIITVNNWYCAAFVSDGATWSIYLNGVAETLTIVNGTNDGKWFGDTDYTNPQFTLGTLRYSAGYVQYYIGLQGEVLIYNRALTAGEIQRIYLKTKKRYQ